MVETLKKKQPEITNLLKSITQNRGCVESYDFERENTNRSPVVSEGITEIRTKGKTTDIATLVKQQDIIFSRSKDLGERLTTVLKMLQDCKLVEKPPDFKLRFTDNKNISILKNFDHTRFVILVYFLFDFYEQYVQTPKTGRLLHDMPNEKRAECLKMMQVLLACTIAMITVEKTTNEVQKPDYLDLEGEIQLVDQIQLATYLYALIIKEDAALLRRDAIEVVLNFMDEHYESMVQSQAARSRAGRSLDLPSKIQSNENVDYQLSNLAQTMLCSLAFCTCLVDVLSNIDSRKYLDEDIVLPAMTKLLNNQFSLILKQQASNFLNKIYSLPDILVGQLLKECLKDYPSMNYYGDFSLFNLILQITLKVLQKWSSKFNRKQQQQTPDKIAEEREKKIIQSYEKTLGLINEACIKQINYYQLSDQAVEKPQYDVVASTADDQVSGFVSKEKKTVANEEWLVVVERGEQEDTAQIELQTQKLLGNCNDYYQRASSSKPDEYALDISEPARLNWIRTNNVLFEIIQNLLRKTFNRRPWDDKKQSTLNHICDLYRVQMYFLVRFDYFRPYMLPEKQIDRQAERLLSGIPENISYDCNLATVMRKFFFLLQISSDKSQDVTVQTHILDTLCMVASGAFDFVDKRHYLKVYFLIFTLQNITENESNIVLSLSYQDDASKAKVQNALFKLFSMEFYSNKYTRLFEELFDLDQVDYLIRLQEILSQQDLGGKKIEAEIKINKALVQKLSISIMIQLSKLDSFFTRTLMKQIEKEVEVDALLQCNPNGDIYVERSTQIQLNPDDIGSTFQMVEFVLSKNTAMLIRDNSTLDYDRKDLPATAFSSRLYQVMKLLLGLITKDLNAQSSKITFNILQLTDNHNDVIHKQNFQMSMGHSFNTRMSTMNLVGPTRVSGQKHCDDCLRCNFQVYKLEEIFTQDPKLKQFLADIFASVLNRIQAYESTLDQQRQIQIQACSTKTSINSSQILTAEVRSQIRQQRFNTSQVLDKHQREKNQKPGFKIVEIVSEMMMRFMIHVTQNPLIGLSVVHLIFKPSNHIMPKFVEQSIEDFKDIKNQEFRLTMLRNIVLVFNANEEDESNSEIINQVIKSMGDLLKASKAGLQALQQQEYELTVELESSLSQSQKGSDWGNLGYNQRMMQSQSDPLEYMNRGRSRANTTTDRMNLFIDLQKQHYKRIAEISITVLSLQTQVDKKSTSAIFQLLKFQEQVLHEIRKFIMMHKTYIGDLINEGLKMLLFPKKELSDPFEVVLNNNIPYLISKWNEPDEKEKKVAKTTEIFYERIFDFILLTAIDYIQLASPEGCQGLSREVQMQIQNDLQTSLKKMIETLNQRIVVDESVTTDVLKLARNMKTDNIKQIKKIFIFLREQNDIRGINMSHSIKLLSQLVVRIFSVVPKAENYRDFFSFMREILYRNQEMDEVDGNLLEDVLKILDNCLRQKQQTQGLAVKLVDHFHFGPISPGQLLLNEFRMDKEPSMCILFRISTDKISEEMKGMKNQQIRATLLSFKQRFIRDGSTPQNVEESKFEIEITIDIDKNIFTLKNPFAGPSTVQNEQVLERPLENKWHFLMVRFKKSKEFLTKQIMRVDVFLDKLYNDKNQMNVVTQINVLKYDLPKLNINVNYYFSLGNTVESCINRESSQTGYFRGRVSLPFFFGKIPNCNEFDNNQYQLLVHQLVEMINQRQILNVTEIDLLKGVKNLVIPPRDQKKFLIPEFKSYDFYTQPIILLHHMLQKQGHLCAVHCKRASDVFVGIGGFKNLLPIFDKIKNSNLLEVGRAKPGQILGKVFKILCALIDQEPQHIKTLFTNSSLIPMIQYCLMKIGKYQMITPDFLFEVKKVVRLNILTRVQLVSMANGEIKKENLFSFEPQRVRKQEEFLKDFFRTFTHEILLSENIATLTCQLIPKQDQTFLSTTHSSISGGSKTKYVFEEFMELIHNIFCPPKLMQQRIGLQSANQYEDTHFSQNSQAQQTVNSNPNIGKQNVCIDFEELRKIIVNDQTTTVKLMLNLVENTQINQIQNLQLLTKLGECIASTIICFEDADNFKYILTQLISSTKKEKVSIKVFLQVVLTLIRDKNFYNTKKLRTVFEGLEKDFNSKISDNLKQFDVQSRVKLIEESRALLDAIISLTLLVIQQTHLNAQTRYGKQPWQEDKEKKQKMVKTISDQLQDNTTLSENTYLTLIYFAFKRRSGCDSVPTVDLVATAINNASKESKARQLNSDAEFDPEYFLIVLDLFDKYVDSTKELFFNNFMLFLKYHNESFMKLFKTSNEAGSSTRQKLMLFLYRISQQCYQSEDDKLIKMAQNVCVEICAHQFLNNIEDTKQKSKGFISEENGELGLFVFRRIYTFFQRHDRKNEEKRKESVSQFTLLQLVLKKILSEINTKEQEHYMYMKLNQKVILLLQFSEEVYVNQKDNFSEIESKVFFETLLALMYLCEQLGILTLDMPDNFAYEYSNSDEGQAIKQRSSLSVTKVVPQVQNQDNKSLQSINQYGLSVHRLADKAAKKIAEIEKETPTMTGDKTPELKKDKINRRFDESQSNQQNRFINFVNGGPVRIFMHILLNCMYDSKTSPENFTNVIVMLRYMVLRDRSAHFSAVIHKVFGDWVEFGNTAKVFNMFDRIGEISKQATKLPGGSQFEEESKEASRLQTTSKLLKLKQPNSHLNPSERYLKAEIEVFKGTIKAIMQTTGYHVAEEYFADKLTEEKRQPSYQSYEISCQNLHIFEKSYFSGFTMVEGFLLLQFIGEVSEILLQIVTCKNDNSGNHASNDTADFNVITPSRAFVGDEQMFTSQQDDEMKAREQSITIALANEAKFQKIKQLLKFLHDCLSEQLGQPQNQSEKEATEQFMQKLRETSLFTKIANHTERMSQAGVDRNNLTYFCSFMDNPMLVDGISEQFEESFMQESDKLNQFSNSPDKKLRRLSSDVGNLELELNDSLQDVVLADNIRLSQFDSNYFPNTSVSGSQKSLKDSQHPAININMTESQATDPEFLSLQKYESVISSTQSVKTVEAQSVEEVTEGRMTWFDEDLMSPILKRIPYSQDTKLSKNSKKILDDSIQMFLEKFARALKTLYGTGKEVDQQKTIQKILYNLLCKDAPGRLNIAFIASTSSKFSKELKQVVVNSGNTFKRINDEIIQMTSSTDKQFRRGVLTQVHIQNQDFKASEKNYMMMSQQIFGATLFESVQPVPKTSRLNNQSIKDKANVEIKMNTYAKEKANVEKQMDAKSEQFAFNDFISTSSQNTSLQNKNSLDYIFTRKQYKKSITRLYENESQMWFDHLEQESSDFKEIKEIYDQLVEHPEADHDHSEKWLKDQHDRITNAQANELSTQDQDKVSKFIDQCALYGRIIPNPYPRNYFVKQRRNMDKWGRMMLIKANRKALQYNNWLYYDYYIFDYLNKMFAASLLKDEDFPDCLKPPPKKLESSKSLSLDVQANPARPLKRSQSTSITNLSGIVREEIAEQESSGDENNPDTSFHSALVDEVDKIAEEEKQDEAIPYSLHLQKVREELMRKLETNKLLQKVLSQNSCLIPKKASEETSDEEQKRKFVEAKRMLKLNNLISAERKNQAIKGEFCFPAQRVSPRGCEYGMVIVTKQYFYFYSLCCKAPSDIVYLLREDGDLHKEELIIRWSEVEEVFKRKILNVFQGIDVYTIFKKCYTFNLLTQEACKLAFEQIEAIKGNRSESHNFEIVQNPVETFKKRGYTEEWKELGLKSNQEFLMLVNKFSGRSMNDLSQSPIFPYVLSDYSSNLHDFNEKMKHNACFRNFSQNLGVIDDKKIEVMKKYHKREELIKEDETGEDQYMVAPYEPYHLFQGFSNKSNTCMFMLRLEPYSFGALMFNDYKKEYRTHNNYDHAWQNIMSDDRGCLELSPEHYFMPEMMLNFNCFSLGFKSETLQDKTTIYHSIDTVYLPQWSFNVFDFVRVMRESLESKHVTENIGLWVDQIFGVNQKSDEKMTKFPNHFYEEWHSSAKNRQVIKEKKHLLIHLNEFYICPTKLFDSSVQRAKNPSSDGSQMNSAKSTTKGATQEQPPQKENTQKIIKLFLENQTKDKRSNLGLYQIADHVILEEEHNIVHMLFTNNKLNKCLFFIRQKDKAGEYYTDAPNPNFQTGNLVVISCQETITSKENLNRPAVDLGLRYEYVYEDLYNILQVFSDQCHPTEQYLYVAGYLDNTIRVFNLSEKVKAGKNLVHVIKKHQARVTCMKFSNNFQYLITCDADGVINHFVRSCHGEGRQTITSQEQKTNKFFPFKLKRQLQDQMDEITAIDINSTLDMYVTLSTDGTIALRCLRTSQLWQHFKFYSRMSEQPGKGVQNRQRVVTGFSKIFRKVNALKLSYHGYIVVIGSSPTSSNVKYLVYSLNGDFLLTQIHERVEIKDVSLNSTEDQLILAQNFTHEDTKIKQGIIRVVKLYGLEKLANLAGLFYHETISTRSSSAQQNEKKIVPAIGAFALKRGEANLNIFFCGKNFSAQSDREVKETICFDISRFALFDTLEGFALTTNTRRYQN